MKTQKDIEKYIYIAFLSTSTKMGKLIRFVTKNKYNHVSLSFDKNLSTLYSFARYRVNAPFAGGFVEESALRYFYSHNELVSVKICAVPLSLQKHEDVLSYINTIKESRAKYIYNSFSAALAPIHKKMQIKDSFTCLEFAYSVLAEFNIKNSIDIRRFYTIADLEELLKEHMIFEGNMKQLSYKEEWGSDLFFAKISYTQVFLSTIKHFAVLTKRLFSIKKTLTFNVRK